MTTFLALRKSELKNAEDSDIELVNNKLQPFYCRTTKDDLGVPRAEPDVLIKVPSGERTNLLLGVIKNRYRRNKLTLMLRVLQMENDPIDLLETLNPEDYRWIIEEDEETGEVDAVDYSDKDCGHDSICRRIEQTCSLLLSDWRLGGTGALGYRLVHFHQEHVRSSARSG